MLEHWTEVESRLIVGKAREPLESLQLRHGHLPVHLRLNPDSHIGIESLSCSIVGGLQLGDIDSAFVVVVRLQHNRCLLSMGELVGTTW